MSDPSPVEAVFFAALERANPVERVAYLEQACAGNPDLRARVEKLLSAHPNVGDFLGDPQSISSATIGAPDNTATRDFNGTNSNLLQVDAAGVIIAGRYKLLQQIGEGGMGTVWMADQTEPVKRRVAVKLIRAERGISKTILTRFEAERQAIALMDHPNIAKLLDAGTEGGAPFFVMELVKGVPLTDYCDTHKLSIPDRLQLFQHICSAVQHAHQKGVIHRDLKPTNILIESHDGKPVPKIIDFGLAKATSGLQLTDQTLFTGFGLVMGTPLYMAPEQASFNAIDVDTRADVYALGVILYELLTGTTPLTRDTVKKAQLDEMLRLIRDQEAVTPSSRLSSSESKPTVAANRQTEPAKLGRFIKGDLDWIVLKAISKDRDRRYESANSFALDLGRFLNHEAVDAHPPSVGYRMRKFVRRNKGLVTSGTLILLALILGVAGTTFGLIRAEERRKEADQAREREADRADGERQAKEAEVIQRHTAEAATQQANKRLDQVKRGINLLAGIFKDFNINEVRLGNRPIEVVVVDRIAKAADQLDVEAIGDPLEVAILQCLLAQSLQNLGAADKALPFFEKNLETFLKLQGPDDPEYFSAINNLAQAYLSVGRIGEAISMQEKLLKKKRISSGDDHPDTLVTMNNLALAYEMHGRIRESLPLRIECLRRREAVLGPDHVHTLESMNGLAAVYLDSGRAAEAIPLFEKCHKKQIAVLGAEHRFTLISLNNWAEACSAVGRIEDAIRMHEDCLNRRKKALGPDHPDTLGSVSNLALVYSAVGRNAEAITLMHDGLRVRQVKMGHSHPDTLSAQCNLGTAYLKLGRIVESLPLLEDCYKRSRETDGPETSRTLKFANNLGMAYKAAGRPAEAVPLLEICLRADELKQGKNHPGTVSSIGNLASAYLANGQLDQGVQSFGRVVSISRTQSGGKDPFFSRLLASVSVEMLQVRQYVPAEPLIRESLAIREKSEPNEWTTYFTNTLLGWSLLGQKKYADAEPLLLKGYEGMKTREKMIPPQARERIVQNLDRLIDLYSATKKPDELKKWQAERAKYPREMLPMPKNK